MNKAAKGAKYQLLFIKEFIEYHKPLKYKYIAIWNSPNIRPMKRPEFLNKKIEYSHKDYLGFWDVGILAYNENKELIEARAQIKSKFSLKEYTHFKEVWKGHSNLHTDFYYAVYDMKLKREPEYTFKSFKVFDVARGFF